MQTKARMVTLERAWERISDGGRGEALLGEGPGRLTAAYANFIVDRTWPSALLEFPLRGAPTYDVLVGGYGGALRSGARISAKGQDTAQRAVDWLVARGSAGLDLFFELDAIAADGQSAGIHCKHDGRPDDVRGFFEAIGIPAYALTYQRMWDRLPEGWDPFYAAVFPGRVDAPARMELLLDERVRLEASRDPSVLARGFGAIGFDAYDDAMLETCSRLLALGRVAGLQLDLMPDGSVGDTVSLPFYLEEYGGDPTPDFMGRPEVHRMMCELVRLGLSDGRHELIGGALFAGERLARSRVGRVYVIGTCVTATCAKIKWRGGRPDPAKFYLTISKKVYPL